MPSTWSKIRVAIKRLRLTHYSQWMNTGVMRSHQQQQWPHMSGQTQTAAHGCTGSLRLQHARLPPGRRYWRPAQSSSHLKTTKKSWQLEARRYRILHAIGFAVFLFISRLYKPVMSLREKTRTSSATLVPAKGIQVGLIDSLLTLCCLILKWSTRDLYCSIEQFHIIWYWTKKTVQTRMQQLALIDITFDNGIWCQQ